MSEIIRYICHSFVVWYSDGSLMQINFNSFSPNTNFHSDSLSRFEGETYR